MGYELAYFVRDSAIDREFVCAICSMVLENPVETPCEHIFCSKCIKGWIAVQANCPVDHQAIRLVDLKPTPQYFRNLLAKLEVRCEFGKFELKTHSQEVKTLTKRSFPQNLWDAHQLFH